MTWARSPDGKILCGSCQRVISAGPGGSVSPCPDCFPGESPVRIDHLAIVFGGADNAKRGGPGTELKLLLQRFLGVSATANCPCAAHAIQMDSWGPDECELRVDEIVGWLRVEAERRRLPFVAAAAKQLVLLAVRRARKAAAGGPSGDINP